MVGIVSRRQTSLVAAWTSDSAYAQFARFIVVGAVTTTLYAVVFAASDGLGALTANLVGTVVSTALGSEMHRRLTFHAAERVGWFPAQWEGGGLALVGLVISTAMLGALEVLAPGMVWYLQVLLVMVVTGVVGALRFLALRGWVF